MNKYIGKYRVLSERDLKTGKPINNVENIYISCYRKIQIHRVDDKILCLTAPFRKTNATLSAMRSVT